MVPCAVREEAAERKRREESGEPAPLETREAVGDEARARAEALKGEGNALVEEKRWAEAEAKYTEALGQDGANAACVWLAAVSAWHGLTLAPAAPRAQAVQQPQYGAAAPGQEGRGAAGRGHGPVRCSKPGCSGSRPSRPACRSKLRPEWHKAHFRVGCAQRDAGRYVGWARGARDGRVDTAAAAARHEASAQAFWEAVQKDNTNEQYMKAFNAAIKRARVAAGRQ